MSFFFHPSAKGLFHKAIPQSFNSLGRRMPTIFELEAAGEKSAVTNNIGTPMDRSDDKITSPFGSKTLSEMRAMKAGDLIAVSIQASPNIDGYVLPASMLEILKAGKQNDIPVIAGMVEGDAALFSRRFGGRGVTLELYKQNATKKYGELAEMFLSLYPAENNAEAVAQNRTSALDDLNVLSYFFGKARAIKGKADTYLYFFTHVMPGSESAAHGAFHTADVPYSFNYFSPMRADYWTKLDFDIGNRMSDYLVDFMKSGKPNGQNLPEWPAWEDSEIQLMELGDTFAPLSIPEEKTGFWEAFYNRKFVFK
jgi:para-nitrobenzyl esterase